MGEESVETNADESPGKNVEQETPQELLRGQSHQAFLVAMGVVLVSKGHFVVLEGD
jgi:hypothetical protein